MERQRQLDSKRQAEVFTMVESATTDAKQQERDRCKIKDQIVEVRKREEEEDEARGFRIEMLLNLSKNKSFEARQKLINFLLENIEASDKERRRPNTIMTKL